MRIFKQKQKGAAAVEYAVIILLICIAVIVAITSVGIGTKAAYERATEAFQSAQSEDPGKNGKCKDSDADKDCGIGND